MGSVEIDFKSDSFIRDEKAPRRFKGKTGFMAGGGIFFIVCPVTYGITGLLPGKPLGHPLPGEGLGGPVGLCPSAPLSVRAHYNGCLSFLPLGYLIAFTFLSDHLRMVVGIM